jgi:hypothetical protein
MRITFLEEKMVWDLTVGELKELFFNESSTNRIKPSSNESPKFVPSKKTIENFKEIATEEAMKMQKPTHKEFVQMGKDILNHSHVHGVKPKIRPRGRPRKVIE